MHTTNVTGRKYAIKKPYIILCEYYWKAISGNLKHNLKCNINNWETNIIVFSSLILKYVRYE